ncbi:MAG: sigma-70 family RNA polymerase sigma factor [Acidovorax sp.]
MHENSASLNVETLYFDHHRWLNGWLRRRLGDSHRAADLAQDVFMRLLTKQETFFLAEPRAFLTTVATRVLANHWQREQLEQAYLETLQCIPESLAPSPEERAIILETLHEIDTLLNGLPVPVKRAFLMSQLEGLTQLEIAEQLKITERTVRRHLLRAAQQVYFADVR